MIEWWEGLDGWAQVLSFLGAMVVLAVALFLLWLLWVLLVLEPADRRAKSRRRLCRIEEKGDETSDQLDRLISKVRGLERKVKDCEERLAKVPEWEQPEDLK